MRAVFSFICVYCPRENDRRSKIGDIEYCLYNTNIAKGRNSFNLPMSFSGEKCYNKIVQRVVCFLERKSG